MLAHPNPGDVVAGTDLDPVTTAVTHAFGGWADKPFVLVVLISFTACLMASQGGAARGLYSLARDEVFPFSRQVRKVNAHRAPIGGLVAATLISCAALPLGLSTSAIGSLMTFGSAAIFAPFFLISLVALVARLRGSWTPAGAVGYGRLGTPLNLLAVLWTGFELVNICWPRAVLAPAGAPWYQIWAAPLGVATVTLAGLAYLLARRPDRRMDETGRDRPLGDELAPAVL